MKINDNIYSVEEIKDKVLIELINSKPIQRLKGIKQAGITGHILEDRDCTRYDHSVGVMVLLRKKQASLEEQIAGLLHDVSHTAFSHVVDFVYKTKEHNYHELFYEKIIRNSEIPSILKKHGFNLNRLSNENNFHLLEREIPDLCADRIDYALRDLNGFYTNGKLDNFIRSLVNINNEFVFSDFETAKEFAFNFINLDEKIWANIIEVTYFQIAADAIKIALENNILKEEDLFKQDVSARNLDGYHLMEQIDSTFKLDSYELTCWMPEIAMEGIRKFLKERPGKIKEKAKKKITDAKYLVNSFLFIFFSVFSGLFLSFHLLLLIYLCLTLCFDRFLCKNHIHIPL